MALNAALFGVMDGRDAEDQPSTHSASWQSIKNQTNRQRLSRVFSHIWSYKEHGHNDSTICKIKYMVKEL